MRMSHNIAETGLILLEVISQAILSLFSWLQMKLCIRAIYFYIVLLMCKSSV